MAVATASTATLAATALGALSLIPGAPAHAAAASQPAPSVVPGAPARAAATSQQAIGVAGASALGRRGTTADAPAQGGQRGAPVPFVEQEAEASVTNGTVIGPDRTYTTLPSEASGRRAVRLDGVGQYVEFTLSQPANAMTVRYAVPDRGTTGLTAPVDLRINGTTLKSLPFTSKYGWYYGAYPYVNDPAAGTPHHFYDEVRTMFGSTLGAGTKVRIQVTSTSVASWFIVDLADFEVVPTALERPAGSLSVIDYGADPSGVADSTSAIQRAVDAGRDQGRTVWIPQGTFKVTDHVIVDRVTVQGAGMWYTVLTGRHPTNPDAGVGIFGKFIDSGAVSRNVTVSDLAVLGEVVDRDDDAPLSAFGGGMTNSTIARVWMQHTKVGAWMTGPMDKLTITDCRILDQTADGVNFYVGVTNSTVRNTFVRNTGDDGLAMWSNQVINANNSFVGNTVVLPILANSIAIYGGRDMTVTDNTVADTVTNGGGIHIGNRFPGVSPGAGTGITGTHTIARNTLLRAGNSDTNWKFGVGAIWFNAVNGPFTGATINVTDTDIIDSSYQAIGFIEGTITGVNFNNVNIVGAGTFAVAIQAPGSASFTNVKASGIGYSNPIYSCAGGDFTINQGPGNSGWYTPSPYCGPWPAPVYTNPPGGTNLALGRPVSETSHTDVYRATNAVDGDPSSYWESANNAFPQSITVDLGAVTRVGRLVLRLPPASGWAGRSQTLSVLGSTDGTSYSTIIPPIAYAFDPAAGNAVTVSPPASSQRHIRLTFTANTGWPAGQLSEFEVYAS